jgi:uncharacterized membrane protein YedE/YeeE
MTLPIEGIAALWLAVLFGAAFGFLLHRGRVTDYDVIVNQFRLRDFTVLKVMFTAILVGGVGVLALHAAGHAQYQVKPANMLGVALGSAVFGAGMVIYGYCPGTGVAAVATGSVHALVGFLGMLAGGVLYALSFRWVDDRVLSVAAMGKVRLPDLTGIPDWLWLVILLAVGAAGFWLLEGLERRRKDRDRTASSPAAPRVTAASEAPSGAAARSPQAGG